MGPQFSRWALQGPYKRKARSREEGYVMAGGGREQCEVGPQAKEWVSLLRAKKVKDKDYPLRIPRRSELCQHLNFNPVNTFQIFDPRTIRKQICVEDTEFVVICYRGSKKLLQRFTLKNLRTLSHGSSMQLWELHNYR